MCGDMLLLHASSSSFSQQIITGVYGCAVELQARRLKPIGSHEQRRLTR